MRPIILGVLIPILIFAALSFSVPVAVAADAAMTINNISPDSGSYLASGVALKDGDTDLDYAVWPTGDVYLMLNATAIGTGANASPSLVIKHGDNPPAFREGLGDLTLSIPANRVYIFGPLESARFINETGYLRAYGKNITTATISLLRTLN
jgi:hypothetical protein